MQKASREQRHQWMDSIKEEWEEDETEDAEEVHEQM